jgi:hypothetical protein
VLNFDTEYGDAFEARYPDGSTGHDGPEGCGRRGLLSTRHASDSSYSGSITIAGEVKSDTDKQYGSSSLFTANGSYTDSADNRQAKFVREKWDYFDVYKLAAYYVYLQRLAAVDQWVKNAMFTTEGTEGVGTHCKWFYINYDNDTVNGLVNDGPNVVPPTADRSTVDSRFSSTTYYFAGHESTLWNNLEADAEFMRIVSAIDQALYVAGLTYAQVINMFDVLQCGRWNERIYNTDAQYKYIGPYVNDAINNLFMCQGSRRSHRRWWLSHRFNLIDSMLVSGGYKGNCFEFKVANAPSGISFGVTAGALLYYGFGVNSVVEKSGVKLNEGESTTFTTTAVLNVGDPLRIYGAVSLEEVDIHNFLAYLAQITMTNVYSATMGTKMKKLVIGVDTSSSSVTNTSLAEISGLAMAKRLEHLDIGGCAGITTLDLSALGYLKTLKAFGSGLTSLILASGGAVSTLELPASLIALSLDGLASLSSGLSIKESGKNIATLLIRDCPSFDSKSFVLAWMAAKTTANAGCKVSLYNVSWTGMSADDLISLGGIKSDGGSLVLTGKIVVPSITNAQISSLMSIFGDNCFKSDNELYIAIPDGIYLVGNTTVYDGSTVQYKAVGAQKSGEPQFFLLDGSSEVTTVSSCTIDTNTGLLTVTEIGASRNITIRVKYGTESKDFSISVVKLVYPSSATVTGTDWINASGSYEFDLSLLPSGINAEYNVEWTLSGTAVDGGFVSITTQDKSKLIISSSTPSTNSNLKITVSIISKNGTVVSYKNVLIEPDVKIMTSSSNSYVMAKCYALGWAKNADYMYLSEAKAVSAIGTNFAGIYFLTFDELQYFTKLTKIDDGAFNGCWAMTHITLPDSIKSINYHAFESCSSLTEIVIPEGVTEIGNEAYDSCRAAIKIDLPSTLKSIGGYTFNACTKVSTFISRASAAPSSTPGTFGGGSSSTRVGGSVSTVKTLYVPANATGYDASYWASSLCSSSDCNFTLSKTL